MTRSCRVLAVTALLLASLVLPPGRGRASPELAAYNGTVSATAIHMQAGTSAFPNFATGAVDNRYPLAVAHQDGSPFSLAYATPLDTGPAGQTATGTAQQRQPHYAEMRCPPQCGDQPAVVGSEPAPFAASQASETKAAATARAAGRRGWSAVVPVLDPGRTTALRNALSTWRNRFLTVDDARRRPMPAAGTPDGFGGDTADSETRLDGGVLVLTGDSAVAWIRFGDGAVTLHDVHVRVAVTNDGTPKKAVTVRIGAAEVGGIPVTIGPDGVSVKGQAVPGLAGNAEGASAALNEALRQAGIEMRAMAPIEQTSEHQLTLDAVGVVVRVAPPSPAPGTPAQFTTLAVGQVFADALAIPGSAGDNLGDDLPDVADSIAATEPTPASRAAGGTEVTGSITDVGGTTLRVDVATPGPDTATSHRTASDTGDSVTSQPLAPRAPAQAPAGSTMDAAPSATRLDGSDKPIELLLLYFLWQSLMIGTVASLWLWRRGAP